NSTSQLINNNTNGTINGTAVTNGMHTFVIQATDPTGNSANTTQGTFTVATPTTLTAVNIVTPATNNTNTTNVTQNLIFNATSTIHNFTFNYTVFRNGLSIASAFMNNNTNTVVIPGSANGTYTYYVEVKDPSGNFKNSSTITWTIDQIAPVISNLTTNNSNFSSASPSFAFNVTDNTATSTINITLFIDGVVNGTTQLINNNTNGTINGTAVTDGLHTFIIQAIDPAGNSVNMTQNSTFRVDTVVPNVAIQAPVNGTNSSSTIRLNFTHGDATSSAFCQLELDSINVTNVTAGTCLNVTLTGLAEGNHTIRLWVNDSATNRASATVRFTVDTVIPIVSLSASKGGITIGSAVDEGSVITITCSSSDNTSSVNTTTVKVSKPSNTVDTKACGNTYTLTESGSYTITYTSVDDAGNTAIATKTFSTSAVSPVTGGGGGGGGSSTSPASSSTSVIVGVSPGQTYEATVTKEDVAVDQVTFTTTGSASSVEIKVENYGSNVPSGATSITSTNTDAKVYQYLQINTVNLNSILKEAKVKFSATKKWIADNGLTADKVALYKFKDNAWVKMPTVKTAETSTDVNYETTVTSFSIFVIAGEAAPPAPQQPQIVCGNGVCETGETESSCAADCKPTEQGSVCGNGVCESDESTATCETDCPAPVQEVQKQDYGLYIVAGVIIFLIIVFYLFTKFRSSGYNYKPKKK
ncbi:MAG: PGF-pre-PGF domain-containing protein, partial [Candidatus Aenigmarchaeota archaeon]|nr:PGF-pre-PGF domain-containing protein [Candidatus Aenigmarchaeota archaeon]